MEVLRYDIEKSSQISDDAEYDKIIEDALNDDISFNLDDNKEDDTWTTDALFIDSNENTKYYKTFTRVKGNLELFSVHTGDFVYINDTVGLVCSLWENDVHQKISEIRCFYRPHQTVEGIKPYHGNAEILISTEVKEYPTSTIQGLVCFFSFLYFHRLLINFEKIVHS